MGNCFPNSNANLVHPTVLQSLLPEGMAPSGAGPTRIKVRMTAREFKEVVARAEARKCNTGAVVGMLILEGVKQGRWGAVRIPEEREGEGGGGAGYRGNARAPQLEAIHEDQLELATVDAAHVLIRRRNGNVPGLYRLVLWVSSVF